MALLSVKKLKKELVPNSFPFPCYKSTKSTKYLSIKEIVCFFCLACWNLPNHRSICYARLISLESPQWVGVHQVGFIIFWHLVEKLLHIEHFQLKFSFKSKLIIIEEFGCILGLGKSLVNRFNECDLEISKPKF